MKSFDAGSKLVIAGSHDISLDDDYWRTHLEKDDNAKEYWQAFKTVTGPLAIEAGTTYLTEGVHIFELKNGATFQLYATPYQPACDDGAFAYKRGQDRFNWPDQTPKGAVSTATGISFIPDDVDIMLTHGPPRNFVDFIPSTDEHAGWDALLRAAQRVRPLLHCFGHIHEGHGVQKVTWDEGDDGKGVHCAMTAQGGIPDSRREVEIAEGSSTLMVNAAIMDDHNQPAHAPWLVELDLPA